MAQSTFSEAQDLATHLSALELAPGGLITVDGMDGSGKSHLGRTLAEGLNTQWVEIDNFLNRKQGGFVDHIRYTDLADELQGNTTGPAVVVEGCCIQEVMSRVGRVPDVSIYLKRLVAGVIWMDGDFLTKYHNSEDAIAGETEKVLRFTELCPELMETDVQKQNRADPLSGLLKELIRYHFEHRPHETADIIFARST